MRHHDRLRLRVDQELDELGAMSTQAGTDVGYRLHNRPAMVVRVNRQASFVLPNPLIDRTKKL